jgi:release factor glutamine methyltransferase
MKIKEALEEAKKELIKNNIEDSLLICRELLSFTLKQNKQYLIINQNEEISIKQYNEFKENIKKIINGIPLQYITNKQEFMKLNFYVDKNVLIPQPDTEILVESVIELSKKIKANVKILDLCTGSGAIAISIDYILKQNNIKSEVFASDISSKALEIAKRNNQENNTNVKFILSNLFTNIDNKFNIIVSNPPYIKTKEIETLSKQVQNEPILALNGGIDGLDFYKKIVEEAYKYITESGYLCLEIGYDQKEDVIELINKNNNYKYEKCIKDLSNNNRCIIAQVRTK